MNIDRCYELFLTDRKISGCSEATLRFYEYVIGKLLRFIEENIEIWPNVVDQARAYPGDLGRVLHHSIDNRNAFDDLCQPLAAV